GIAVLQLSNADIVELDRGAKLVERGLLRIGGIGVCRLVGRAGLCGLLGGRLFNRLFGGRLLGRSCRFLGRRGGRRGQRRQVLADAGIYIRIAVGGAELLDLGSG